jgi:hypothetical protein
MAEKESGMSSSTIRLVGILALATVFGSCASMIVRSYVDPGVNLRHYRTYNWEPLVPRPTGDPRLDNNRFFHERVQTAVEGELARRGFEKTDSPDLLIHYHASVSQEIYVIHNEDSQQSSEAGTPEVYDAGTLLIDLVDARTHRLLWRAWAEDSFDGVIDNQAWMEQKVDQAVARILGQLPKGL